MAGRWQNLYDLNIRFRFEEIRQLVFKGYRDYEIARMLELTPKALRGLRKKYPELDDVFKDAKKYLSKKISEAMIKNALGYEHDEVQYEETKDSKGNWTQKKKVIKKHFQPNPTAGIFLLCNYDGDNYKRLDKEQVNVVDQVNIIDDLGVEFDESKDK